MVGRGREHLSQLGAHMRRCLGAREWQRERETGRESERVGAVLSGCEL